ncbi:MAG: ImmA/IrrE family metallo-endopeptidase [Candidatus Hydrogenedentota bacterium]
MSVHWERLSGDTDRFAIKMAFQRDPDEGAGAGPDEAASWGALQIWVNGMNLCAHVLRGQSMDAMHWYLLPVLEWFARNWDALLHEQHLPNENQGRNAAEALDAGRFPPLRLEEEEAAYRWEENWYAWWSRHALQAARDGGLLPGVLFRRWRSEVEVSWSPTGLEDARMFAQKGHARFEPREVAEPLYEILRETSGYLAERMPDSSRIMELREKVDALCNLERREERLAWLTGLWRDMPTREERWRKVVLAVRERNPDAARAVFQTPLDGAVVLGSCDAALMFGSVAPDIKETDALILADCLADRFEAKPAPGLLDDLARSAPLDERVRPWEQGYELALDFLEDGAREGAGDIDAMLDALGVRYETITLDDRGIRGVALAGPNHSPTILLNTTHATYRFPSGQRLSKAHELCHLLYDRAYGTRVALVSGPWAPQELEQRANAFAAMCLMPPKRVHEVLAGLEHPIDTLDGVAEAAKALNTSFTATLNHLYNLGTLDDPACEAIRMALEERSAMEPAKTIERGEG